MKSQELNKAEILLEENEFPPQGMFILVTPFIYCAIIVLRVKQSVSSP